MIERLTGRCVFKQLGSIILDVAGVGYGVEMTETAVGAVAAEPNLTTLWIHTHVREDALRLFGFPTHGERQLFSILLSISGIGPKLALAIMGTLSIRQLILAVELDDSAPLEEVSGIGPRQSKKILLELKPKLAKLAASALVLEGVLGAAAGPAGGPLDAADSKRQQAPVRLAPALLQDLRSALENFGYKEKEFAAVLRKLERRYEQEGSRPVRTPELADLVRLVLAELAGVRREAAPVVTSDEELF